MSATNPLIVGEVVVDVTLQQKNQPLKLRLGGVVHSARGLWASNIDYSVAAICPKYLVQQTKSYLEAHGCKDFFWLGEVEGAPNVTLIGDPTEIGDQEYEDILRNEKHITIFDLNNVLHKFSEILIFPGRYDLASLRATFSQNALFSFDIAYDLPNLSSIESYKGNIRTIIISTSSPLFIKLGSSNLDDLIDELKSFNPERFLLKENRGGSRLFDFTNGSIIDIPAELGTTINSVGVGDVYSAVLVGLSQKDWKEGAWRAARVATYYSRTTFPDDFKRDVQRDLKLPLSTLETLGGTFLPWHVRQKFKIYLAAPDFSYMHTPEIQQALDSLEYHNFMVVRPIYENGELTRPANMSQIQQTFNKDIHLIKECAIVFAIPLGRDPGTLVEIGLALQMGKPVITYDPRKENDNTMVIGGSEVFSENFDLCLNGIFQTLSKILKV